MNKRIKIKYAIGDLKEYLKQTEIKETELIAIIAGFSIFLWICQTLLFVKKNQAMPVDLGENNLAATIF